MISESRECCKLEQMSDAVFELKEQLYEARRRGEALHVVERDIVRVWLQKVGLLAVEGFIELHGNGDLGPVAVSPQGREMDRLEQTKSRPYLCVFGPLTIERTVYSAGNHQQEYAPLDAILGLPEGKFSFVVQDFAQMLGVDLAWAKDREVLERLLGIKLPVSSLEEMNRKMAEGVPQYRQQRPSPPIEEEEAIFVASGDGKGVVMRKPRPETEKETPSILPPETKGPQPGRKNMAVVGSLYSIAPYVRTPEQMLEILFRDGPRPKEEPPRPRPCGKHVWAAMDDEVVDAAGVAHPLRAAHDVSMVVRRVGKTGSWASQTFGAFDGRRASSLGSGRYPYAPWKTSGRYRHSRHYACGGISLEGCGGLRTSPGTAGSILS